MTPAPDKLAWMVVGLAGVLGLIWHQRDLFNTFIKNVLLGMNTFAIVVAI